MKQLTRTSVFIFTLLLSFSLQAQVADSIYYDRLFYTCKAWGHLKYYHTEISKGNVDWDKAWIESSEGIRDAVDRGSFNQALESLFAKAGTTEVGSISVPTFPDSLNNITDFSWIDDGYFDTNVSFILNDVREKFRPRKNAYLDVAPAGNVIFDNDTAYSPVLAPDEAIRILALFRYWNIINYFFPYKDIMDQDWDETLREMIPLVVKADDALSYNLAMRKLTTRINDSHAFFSSNVYWDWLGRFYTPFHARYIEDQVVITQVISNIDEVRPGNIIVEIDGKSVSDIIEEYKPYASGSNETIIKRELIRMLLRGSEGVFPITVSDGVATKTASLRRNGTNFQALEVSNQPRWTREDVDGCSYGIVDMGRLEISDVDIMMNQFKDLDVIVFDIRNYPNGTLWTLVNYLFPSSIHIASFTTPSIWYPGGLVWNEEFIGAGTSDPYDGKIMILFDERTQSQAEYTIMGLEQFPDAIKIGSTTAAADGNISYIYLPGQITTAATFLGTFYPDYTPTQRVGIIPDFEVKPTIAGIREGRDELMEFALNCDLSDVEESTTEVSFDIFPNPTSYELNYRFSGFDLTDIEVYNVSGLLVAEHTVQDHDGSIDVSELGSGFYIIKTKSEVLHSVTKSFIKH